MQARITPTSEERKLDGDSFIVSRTDTSGKITYANRTFMELSGFPERELLGIQHNIIRHPDMPRGVFHFLWEELNAGREFFGYVKNLCKDGGYYWVFANVTPDHDTQAQRVTGYYSVRRRPPESAIAVIEPVYQEMLRIEQAAASKKQAPLDSRAYLESFLEDKDISYEQFVLGLYRA